MPGTKMLPALLILAATLALSACSGTPLDSTESACDDFAAHAKAGLPAADRADVVASIGEVVANAKPGVQDAYKALSASVAAPDGAYSLAADTFARACFDAGWNG